MNLIFSHEFSLPEYIYLHYPLCRHHCSYCDFNVYRAAGQSPAFNNDWIGGIRRDLAFFGSKAVTQGSLLKGLYLGGGTPSLLSVSELESLLKVIESAGYRISDSTEITLEANPESLSLEKVRSFRSLGINRISLGVQSFQALQLRRLERLATRGHLESALEWVSKYFSNYSVDLMVGLPDQSLELLNQDLDELKSWNPPHISAYILTLKDDHIWKKSSSMSTRMVGDESVETFYLHLISSLKSWGYHHYEVSNFAKPGSESLHNRNYWNTESSYLGLGPGAHGYLQNIRYECERDPAAWLKSATGVGTMEQLNEEQKDLERFYMALRTRKSLPNSQYPQPALSALQQMGLLVEGDKTETFRLSDRGWLLMESVAERLLT